MKKYLVFLGLFLVAAVPMLWADPVSHENEIVLMEVMSPGIIEGDDPFGSPTQRETTPPYPADFRATITGRTLAVTVDNFNSTLLIVRNAAGAVVVNRPFSSLTSEQLPVAGAYSLELQNAGMTLVGQFTAQ